ncbi:hypothetical protein D0861_05903 [Hortaea werneckii]|uniref:Uncharacterized protein n=1 Tax=Hortaea werneckii TaxID=91943 RepID=A0A3M7FDI6_HORWE|nr:hypothetical protein D0861_05903 [Hortaea werneckii]
MASSPTEFLTFYRRLATSSTFRHAPTSRTNLSRRAFANSSRCRADTGNGHVTSTKGTQQGPMSGDKVGGSREHALDKGVKGDPNVQSEQSMGGRAYVDPQPERRSRQEAEEWRSFPYLSLRSGDEAWRHRFSSSHGPENDEYELTYASFSRSRAQNTGGQATREKDERNSTKRAKEEFPEAPDVVIGMQDERGGKGL